MNTKLFQNSTYEKKIIANLKKATHTFAKQKNPSVYDIFQCDLGIAIYLSR